MCFSSIALHPNLCLQLDIAPLLDFVQLQLLTSSQIKDRLTFIDDSISLEILPLFICDEMQFFVQQRNTWRYPEDFTCSIASIYSPFTQQYERKNSFLLNWKKFLKTCDDKNVFSCNENSLLCHNGIISLASYQDSGILCRVKLRNQGKTTMNDNTALSLINYLIPAKALLHLLSKSSMKIIKEFEYKLDHVKVPDTYMLNILPSSQSLVASTLDAIETASSQIFKENILVVTGGKGCGKTYFSLMIATRLRLLNHYTTSYIDCRQLQSSILTMDKMLQELTVTFKQAAQSNHGLLIIENLDALIPNIDAETKDDGQKHRMSSDFANQVKLLSDHFQFLIKGTQNSSVQTENNIIVLVTCRDLKSIHQSLRPLIYFEIKVPTLTSSERIDVFRQLICEKINEKNEIVFTKQEQDRLTKATEGFSPYDLKIAASYVAAKKRHNYQDSSFRSKQHIQNCIEEVLSNFVPTSRQSLEMYHSEPKVTWCDMGGLFQAKSNLAEVILQPIKYKLIYENLPITIPRGILLYGPPGCGKTCIVPALAKQCNYNLITCRGPELFDKYIGASEAKVRQIFEKAYNASPSILFLDEFDSLAPRRGSDNTGVTDRVVNQLLTFLDGVEVHENKDVYIIAASSRPDKIDPALLRPGRLERHVYIGFAENKEEWCDLFTKIALKRKMGDELKRSISDGSFFNSLFKQGVSCLELSAADIKGIFDTAHLKAVHEFLDAEWEVCVNPLMNSVHLLDAFSLTRPSLPHSDRRLLARAYLPFIDRDFGEEECKRGLGLQSSDRITTDEDSPTQRTTLK